MKKRRHTHRSAGQSIPLIALVLVVLFGMVGLSVDVGNTYAEQRSVVRATNAAALSGMNIVIRNGTDQAVAQAIRASYASNGITIVDDPTVELGPGERRITARYLQADGNPIAACTIGNCGSVNAGSVPQGVAYIQIEARGLVDTYFARVVGRDTLPVNTQAFAAQCTPVTGVYPIGIQATDLDINGFIPPSNDAERPYYGTYTDGEITQPRTQRRLYLRDNPTSPGSIGYLRWRSDQASGDTGALTEMLRGDGNLFQGVNEVVPWPDPNTPAPQNYPLEPNELNLGDWIAGNAGFSNRTNQGPVQARLEQHIADRTVMILPIGRFIGEPTNPYFYVQRMGAFYLRGVGLQDGAGWYKDLVYLGDATNTPCLRTNLELTDNLGIIGQVSLQPRWTSVPTRQPISYQILLDVTGSMSWNFRGEGTVGGTVQRMGNTMGGTDIQCESGHEPNRFRFDDQCLGGPRDSWRNYQERRIYVAKNAVKSLIDSMGENDTMRLVVFTSRLGEQARAYPETGWIDPQEPDFRDRLKDAVRRAGAHEGDPYRAAGGTPLPRALQLANQMLSSGAPREAPNGQPYRQVTIIVTDGVANYFLDGTRNDAQDICGNMSPIQARNTADPCQVGVTNDGRRRPITETTHQANLLKENHDTSIFVVGVGGAEEWVGFDQVASQPDWVYIARKEVQVAEILNRIRGKVENDACKPEGGTGWVNHIPAAFAPTPPVGDGVYGYVTLRSQDNTPLPPGTDRLPIIHDPQSGKLSYSLPPGAIAPGIYQKEAFVRYRTVDGVTREYNWLIDPASLSGSASTSFQLSSAGTLGQVVSLNHIFLDLNPNQSLCAP